jgi:RNA 2',3'-cyclic 3'-phosphodiesterase
MRCFIAVDLPKEFQKEIKRIQDKLPEFIGKKTELENLHLTLKFLGEVDEITLERVKEKLKKIKFKPFESEIDVLGFFSEQFIRIIWLHLSNCEELQKQVDLALDGLFGKEERFMGHLTVARIKMVKDKKKFLEEIKKIKISKMKFQVRNFILKKSVLSPKGPIYEDIEVYSL